MGIDIEGYIRSSMELRSAIEKEEMEKREAREAEKKRRNEFGLMAACRSYDVQAKNNCK